MTDVSSLVRSAQQLSSTSTGLVKLQTLLDASAEILSAHAPEAIAVLESRALTPDVHSLACIHILCAAASTATTLPEYESIGPAPSDVQPQTPAHRTSAFASRPDDPVTIAFFDLAAALLLGCDTSQVQLDPRRFSHVCGSFRDIALARGAASTVAALRPLAVAIDAARPGPDHLTPQHAMLFECALRSKAHTAAIPALDEPVFQVEPATTGADAEVHLLYCLHGGSIRAALGDHARASEMFLQAVCAPASELSQIVTAAYKRFILSELASTGTAPQLPRFISPAVQRGLKAAAVEYMSLADAHSSKDVAKLHECAEEHAAVFEEDGVADFVQEVIDSFARQNVRGLTNTYLTLSLEDIASATGMEGGATAAERAVVRMIESGDIHASVSQRNGTVNFQDPGSDQYASVEMTKRLDQEITEVLALADRVRRRDDDVRASKAYLDHVLDGFGGGSGLEMPGDPTDSDG